MSFINDYFLDVKNPIPGIYDQGTISDLDATSLYPSMIKQFNIGIDTFFGRIIPPTMNRIFEFFEKIFGKMDPNNIPENIFQRYIKESETFVENLAVDEFDDEEEERNNKFKNKNEAKQYYYYLMSYLTRKILSSRFTLQQLMRPSNINEYVISRTYFNNLIEVMEMCHPSEKEYNHFAYKYIINNENIDQTIRIVENYNDPSYRIIEMDGNDLSKYLKDNNLGLTISGTLFRTHENKLSLFYQLVKFKLFQLRRSR